MKLKYNILSAVLLVVALMTACKDNDEKLVGGNEALRLTARINGMTSDEFTKLQNGQEVGVWLSAKEVDNDLNLADVSKNARFVQSAEGLVSEPATHWNYQQTLELYAYSPYDAKAGENPAAYAFTVSTEQDEATGNVRNDLLWTKHTLNYADGSATLAFNHLMSKVVLNIYSTSPSATLEDSKVTLTNVKTGATVNLANGGVVAQETKENVVSATVKELPADINIVREAIIVPQTISKGSQLLEILTKKELTYTWETEEDLVIESGKQITLKVEVKETECIVSIQEIADWGSSELIAGDAVGLPRVEVFDYYNHSGIEGIVISVDATGKHGWVVSLDETRERLAAIPLEITGSDDDAFANLEMALENDPTLENFPAMQWCNNKNQGDMTGWVLPDWELLKVFGEAVLKEDETCVKFNEVIQNAPVSDEKKTGIKLGKQYQSTYYISSTFKETKGKAISYCYTEDESWWNWLSVPRYDEEAETPNQGEPGQVRAFHKF